MQQQKEICHAIARLHENILAVFFVQDGAIVEWRARPGIRMPGSHEMEGVMMQRFIMMSLAKNHETFLGRLHYVAGRYDDSDVLLFDHGRDEKSMLVVRVKRPYRMEVLAKKVSGILRSRKENLQ
ncbi:hypothetical protein NTE_00402 [Candidatus Nitrososphaera evergladensis SR1]|uniref:Roadblock/LAMTOR2 domain-containing protein n=1 Tax=Candidatus Nitrososphaera evergladensis SR1 TaxID=1459636 RepID=A0A075MT35_9ARCH|nr:hypothetical protein [Candidatus Nitrososphaera evergladensis]AIF82484.1 hypothetical protein NTE_00402 [Candidatus Nitrososphaera evergladensis SR1]